MDIEGKKPCSPQYIRDENGKTLRDVELICARWVLGFHIPLNTKSLHLKLSRAGNPPTRPTYEGLGCVCVVEMEEAAKYMSNEKAAGPDELPAELLRILLDDNPGLSIFHDTIVDT